MEFKAKAHWEHLKEKDFTDESGVLHQRYMCQKCGLIHEFLDGHTAQYKYCPQCGIETNIIEII